MVIYSRDFRKPPTLEEIVEYNLVRESETSGRKWGRISKYRDYPETIRHFKSLFPNNHIDLFDVQRTGMMEVLSEEFMNLVHDESTIEQDILRFINHKPAFFIIASLFLEKRFGHHDAYIIPEFAIGGGKYRAYYLLIGKSSGGYEFIFVELEAPNGRTIIKTGYSGQAQRSGLNLTIVVSSFAI